MTSGRSTWKQGNVLTAGNMIKWQCIGFNSCFLYQNLTLHHFIISLMEPAMQYLQRHGLDNETTNVLLATINEVQRDNVKSSTLLNTSMIIMKSSLLDRSFENVCVCVFVCLGVAGLLCVVNTTVSWSSQCHQEYRPPAILMVSNIERHWIIKKKHVIFSANRISKYCLISEWEGACVSLFLWKQRLICYTHCVYVH